MSIVDSGENDNWEMKIEDRMGLSESYTLWWEVRESTSLGDREDVL